MRRGAQSAAPSLFPFLSVLVCVMGLLMFLAAATALTSAETAAGNVEIEFQDEGKDKTLEEQGTSGRKPVIVDCDAKDGAITLDGERPFKLEPERELVRKVEREEISSRYSYGSDRKPKPAGELWTGTPWVTFLDELETAGERPYILFLVRPEGVDAFNELRKVVVRRNKARCSVSAPVPEKPDIAAARALSKSLVSRVKWNGTALTVVKALTAAERDELKGLFRRSASHRAVDSLFTRSQRPCPWVDYGSELIPQNWKIKSVGGVELTPSREAQKRLEEREEKQKLKRRRRSKRRKRRSRR